MEQIASFSVSEDVPEVSHQPGAGYNFPKRSFEKWLLIIDHFNIAGSLNGPF